MKWFSPEWIKMCILRFWGVLLLHCEQLKGFAPEWVSMCLLRFPAEVQAHLHCVQLTAFLMNVSGCESWGDKLLCRRSNTVCKRKASLLNGRASIFWGRQLVCKHRASLPSVWLYKTHCVPWGSQAARRRGCTVCKKNATFHCVLDRPQSLFYFVPQEISQLSMIGYCVPPCVFSVWKHGWLSSRTGCSCRTSFHNAESCAFWDLLSSWRRDHTEDMSKVCLQFVFQFPWLVLRSGVAMVLLNQ